MILRCPHCQGACSLSAPDPTVESWACPRCGKAIPASLFFEQPLPPPTGGASPSPAGRTTATKARPKDASKPAASPAQQGTTKNPLPPRQTKGGPSEVPTPIEKALCEPVPRWPRRLMALACLTLGLLMLASSASLAVWKLRKKDAHNPETEAVADAAKEGRVSQPATLATPKKPDNPPSRPEQLYGGIEIGSKGVKVVVVRARATKTEGPAMELLAPAQTANTSLVVGLKENGILDPNALRDTIRVVGTFHDRLRNDHQLSPERIYIIASSGLFSPLQDKPELLETNKRHLAAAIQKATGHDIVFLDMTQDLELTFRASVPPNEVEEALLVDLSSGKTNVCYSDGSLAQFVPLSFPFGAVPLAEEANRRVREREGKFAERIDEILKDEEKREPWLAGLQRHPSLVNLKRVYLTGGPIWALATITHPQEAGPYVALSFADVEDFARRLEESPSGSIPQPKGTEDMDTAAKKRLDSAMRRIGKDFNREQLLAGMRILKALGADLGFKTVADKNLIFARDGYLGPAIGYAVRLKDKKR